MDGFSLGPEGRTREAPAQSPFLGNCTTLFPGLRKKWELGWDFGGNWTRSSDGAMWTVSGEFAYIDWLRRLTPPDPRVVIGPGDDTAALRLTPGAPCLVTTDMMLE